MSKSYYKIVSGEKIQEIADIYIGTTSDFNYNPYIKNQISKHIIFNNLTKSYNNPKIIFCYGHNIHLFNNYMYLFENDFVLITHNSDQNILDTNDVVINILSNPKLIRWYAQNINFYHQKLNFLPIGIANSMWAHGDPNIFANIIYLSNSDIQTHQDQIHQDQIHQNPIKTNKIFMNFQINTNMSKRKICLDTLSSKIDFLPNVNNFDNIKRLSTYEFCICPEGNGLDTHRLWEALYVKTIPILIKSPHTQLLHNLTKLPMILLNSWNDFINYDHLPKYSSFEFKDDYYNTYLSINYIKNMILTS
jgi:hypothetical protein